MRPTLICCVAVFAGALPAVPALAGTGATADVTVNLVENSSVAYRITSTTDPAVGVTGLDNPDMSLVIGTRYNFNYALPTTHPFTLLPIDPLDFISDGSPLMIQAAGTGSLESDPDIAWFNTPTSQMYFTLTPQLADALNGTSTTSPGYRCSAHPGAMRGNITFRTTPTNLTWSTTPVVEDFENAALGTLIQAAFSNWSPVTDDAANYSGSISDQPVGAANQAAGSTRWLRIVDTHDANSVQDRHYPIGIEAPSGETADVYTFAWNVNVEAVGATPSIRNISQHLNLSSGIYANVGGLEFTATGCNVIILGTDDGGVGKAGASVVMPLYTYADAGAFALGDWIEVDYVVDFTAGTITGHATDGTNDKTATASGLALSGPINRSEFRFCIRNHGTGNTSTVSYDNLTFFGTSLATSVREWQGYQ